MKKIVIAISSLIALSGSVMAAGDAAAGKTKSATCAACHGADGNSMVPTFPKLAGQHEAYLEKQIKAFRDGTRKDASMAPMVAGLTDADAANLAAYFASQAAK